MSEALQTPRTARTARPISATSGMMMIQTLMIRIYKNIIGVFCILKRVFPISGPCGWI